MEHRKNLLIIIPTLQLGGQERVAAITAQILKESYHVTMAVFDLQGAVFAPECEVIDLQIPAALGVWRKILHLGQRVTALRRLKKKLAIDISFSAGTTANLANVCSRYRDQTVVRLSSYGEITDGFLNQIIYRLSSRIICCAQDMQLRLLERFPQYTKKVFCVSNPYDVEELEKKGKELVSDYTFSPHTIVFCGRLDPLKNCPRIIKAFSLVRQKVPDAQLLLIGEGKLRQKLEQLVEDYQIGESVVFLGFRTNPFSYLAKASIFVLASYVEGFPNSLVEAMCFVPVVAVDCKSGPREILSDGPGRIVCGGVEISDYGILVNPASDQEWHLEITDDDHTLAEGLLALLQSEELYQTMKIKARSRVDAYSYEAYGERLNLVFQTDP